jgi:hypothetical protein
MQKISTAHTYRQLIPQLLVAGLVYALCLWWSYKTNRALHVEDFRPPGAALTPEVPQPEAP